MDTESLNVVILFEKLSISLIGLGIVSLNNLNHFVFAVSVEVQLITNCLFFETIEPKTGFVINVLKVNGVVQLLKCTLSIALTLQL